MGAESLRVAEATGDTGNEEAPGKETAKGMRAFDCVW